MRKLLTIAELERLKPSELANLQLSFDEKLMLKQINEKKKQNRLELAKTIFVEEEPIRQDFNLIGVTLKSVWDLVAKPQSSKQIFDVLMKHLKFNYSDLVGEGIVRALVNYPKESLNEWKQLIDLYRNCTGGHRRTKEALAALLADIAEEQQIPNLIELLKDSSHGSSRVLLIKRVAKSKNETLKRILNELVKDPELSLEISLYI